MSKYSLTAEVRADHGKEKVKKMRKAGQIPAIIYGAGEDPVSLILDTRDTELILQRIVGEKVMVELKYGGKTDSVFVRDIQRDPVHAELLHVDFYRLDLTKEIDTRLPVHSTGTPIGISQGGILEQGIREVSVRGLPGNIPPHITVDITDLNVDQAIHVSDLSDMKDVKILTAEDSVLYIVKPKAAEVVETSGEEAEEGAEAVEGGDEEAKTEE